MIEEMDADGALHPSSLHRLWGSSGTRTPSRYGTNAYLELSPRYRGQNACGKCRHCSQALVVPVVAEMARVGLERSIWNALPVDKDGFVQTQKKKTEARTHTHTYTYRPTCNHTDLQTDTEINEVAQRTRAALRKDSRRSEIRQRYSRRG